MLLSSPTARQLLLGERLATQLSYRTTAVPLFASPAPLHPSIRAACGLTLHYIPRTIHQPLAHHHPPPAVHLPTTHCAPPAFCALRPPTAYPHQPITARNVHPPCHPLRTHREQLPAASNPPKDQSELAHPSIINTTPPTAPAWHTPSRLTLNHYPQGLRNLLAAQAPTRAHRVPSYAAPATLSPTTTAMQRATCYCPLLDDHLLSDHVPPTTSHLPTNYPLPYPPPSSNHAPPLVLLTRKLSPANCYQVRTTRTCCAPPLTCQEAPAHTYRPPPPADHRRLPL